MDFKGWPVDYSQLFAFSMPGIPVFLAVEGPERFPAFWVASGRLPSLTGRKSKIRRIEKQKAGRCPAIFPKNRYHILVAIKTPLPTPFPIWHLKAAHGER
jgi:hypothetical protein